MTKGDAPRTRNSVQTRERILAAARVHFSVHSYENVGMRDVAAAAGVDAALVNRYFGSKEGLFAEALEGGFRVEEHLSERMDQLGDHLVRQVLDDGGTASSFDALGVLLRAAGNPSIAPLVSGRFHAEFVTPLAALLKGRDADARAALIASYVIGLATMRHGLDSPMLAGRGRSKAARLAAAAIQACVE